jgi:hypothetical protein
VVIKIFAGAGEGKTTLAQWLQTELTKLGFVVENGDPDDTPATPLQDRLRRMADPQDPLRVEIKTIPYKAEGLPAYARRHSEE